MTTSTAGVPSGADRTDPPPRSPAVVEALAGMALPSRFRDLAAEATGVLRWSVSRTPPSDPREALVAVLDSAAVAARLVALLEQLGVDDGVVHAEPARRRWRLVLGEQQGREVARRVGGDPGGRGAVRVPSWLVGGSLPEAVATWRGALLAAGRTEVSEGPEEPGSARAAAVTLPCPSGAAARDMAGLGLRLGIRARVPAGPAPALRVDGPGDAALLLASCGGSLALAAAGLATPREGPADEAANATRAAVAASRTTATVADAFAVLEAAGVDVPAALADAGRLRLRHPTHALVDLAALADPPTSKDALAGRLRRLAALAARHRPGTTPRRR